ncbi:unnamed protein product [Hydatigera taeniaeformis]|uniref:AH domain-containing protein n=1 Tax=Hydatigena taeniaeformis TaxID=6205 RepID=A0A0R3WXI1_HYDTA|nr:unnamed protein product [Hydatigera taeniaeformis]
MRRDEGLRDEEELRNALGAEKAACESRMAALESSFMATNPCSSVERDVDRVQMQMSSLAQRLSDISMTVARLKGGFSVLERAIALQNATTQRMPIENLRLEVPSSLDAVKNPSMEVTNLLYTMMSRQMSKMASLNRVADILRTVRTILLNRQKEIELKFEPLQEALKTAVVSLTTSLDKTFKRAREKAEENYQCNCEALRDLRNKEMETRQLISFLLKKFSLREETKVASADDYVVSVDRITNYRKMVHQLGESIKLTPLEKYTVSTEALEQVKQ